MRIGIVTLPLNNNYGGILQAYALQTILEREGHEVVVFDNCFTYKNERPLWKQMILVGIRLFQKYMLRKSLKVFSERTLEKEYPIIKGELTSFVEHHLHLFYIRNLASIPIERFDAIVIGSDQIWRPSYIVNMWQSKPEDAFLYTIRKSPNIKILSYAASFGVDKWEYDAVSTERIKKAIARFQGISVREDSSVSLCTRYLSVQATHVLDPTLLLSDQDYIGLLKNKREKDCFNGLLDYILDYSKEKSEWIRRISNERDLKVYSVNRNYMDLSLPIEERILPSLETWLLSFMNASFVVTDSFHACVFAILFHKPFIVIGNKERGLERFKSLLKQFELEDHLILTISDYDPSQSYNIPASVYQKLKEKRAASINFLRTSLADSAV